MIVDAWLVIMRNIMAGDGDSIPTHLAVGTDDTAVAAGDTTLNTEYTRVALDSISKPNNDEVMYQGTISAATGNGETFEECGNFNASSGVTMMNRQTYTGILKASTFELRYQTVIKFSNVV